MINGKKGDGIVPAADTSKNSGIPARVWAALIAVCVANVAGHLAVLPSLPAQIPVHWGADGTVNGWGPSWTVAALGFLPLVLLATLWLVPRIDPKGAAYAKSGRFYLGFVIAFTVFMCGMTWLSELTVWGVVPQTGAVGIIVTTAIGVLFIGMGNYLPRVRQPRELAAYAALRRQVLRRHGGGLHRLRLYGVCAARWGRCRRHRGDRPYSHGGDVSLLVSDLAQGGRALGHKCA